MHLRTDPEPRRRSPNPGGEDKSQRDPWARRTAEAWALALSCARGLAPALIGSSGRGGEAQLMLGACASVGGRRHADGLGSSGACRRVHPLISTCPYSYSAVLVRRIELVGP